MYQIWEAVTGEPVADVEESHGCQGGGLALEQDGMVDDVHAGVDHTLESQDLERGRGEIEAGMGEDVGGLEPEIKTTETGTRGVRDRLDKTCGSVSEGDGEAGGEGEGMGARALKESEHAGWDPIVEAGPEKREIEGDRAPATGDMGDVDERGMDRMIPRPGLDVQLRVRLRLEPEQLEDEPKDFRWQPVDERGPEPCVAAREPFLVSVHVPDSGPDVSVAVCTPREWGRCGL